jgi:hypothetical protein
MLNFHTSSKFLFVFLFFSSILIAQNNFHRGSYVDIKGNKNEGFIYNSDWQFNPTGIEFKDVSNGESKQISIDDIQEFEIDGYCKYVKYEGLIDDSSTRLEEFGFNRNPIWKPASVLLKVLIDSDASLFFYNSKNYSRFFYTIKSKDLKIQQLVYKEFYLDGSKTEIGTNFQFRQQLANDLVCNSLEWNVLSKVKYTKKDLMKCFLEYNKCKGLVVDSDKNTPIANKVKFNYSLLIGFSSINFETSSTLGEYQHRFDLIYSCPFGGEVEMIFPINNNKWSLYFQPTYQSFRSEEVVNGLYSPLVYEIDYKSLNLPIGLRHYIFLNGSDSKIYLNGAVGFNFDMGSELVLKNDLNQVFFTTTFGLNVGAGYVFKNRYIFGLQYNYCSDLINATAFKSDFNSLGILFKYQLNR